MSENVGKCRKMSENVGEPPGGAQKQAFVKFWLLMVKILDQRA